MKFCKKFCDCSFLWLDIFRDRSSALFALNRGVVVRIDSLDLVKTSVVISHTALKLLGPTDRRTFVDIESTTHS